MPQLTKAAAHAGVMVALFPSPATAGMLAQPGGEAADDLHVTLAYLGDAADLADPAGLLETVQQFAETVAPIAGEISGVGHFTAGPDPVTYASVDLPGLEGVRERLVSGLASGGFDVSAEHGFQPHVTLAYDDRDVQLPNLPLVFDAVTVAIGGERTSFPLTGVRKDAMVPIEVGDPVRWSNDDLSLGQQGTVIGQAVDENGAYVYDVRWEDGSVTIGARQYRLRNVRDMTLDGLVKAANGSISNAPWDGSPSRFTDDEWKAACLLDRGPTHRTARTRYALPVREPSGAINRRALSAAAARLNQVQGHPEQLNAARAELRRLYVQAGLDTPASLAKADTAWDVPVWKADEQRLVYGIVLQPGIADSQGDLVSPEEIQQAAHRYLVESRRNDVQHDETDAPVDVVESFVAPMDMVVAGRPVVKGAWVMAVHVPDDGLWGRVTSGELTGFSIGGTAIRS